MARRMIRSHELNPARHSSGTKSISCPSSFSWFPSVHSKREQPRKKRKARKLHPQISQISTDNFDFRIYSIYSICENLRNLWINPFVNKRHVLKELRVGADGILRAARKFKSFVLRNKHGF